MSDFFQSPGSSSASAGSFIATFSSGYRLRQEQAAARARRCAHAAGVSTSSGGAGRLEDGRGNSQIHLQGPFARGAAGAAVQDDGPVHGIALCGRARARQRHRPRCVSSTATLRNPDGRRGAREERLHREGRARVLARMSRQTPRTAYARAPARTYGLLERRHALVLRHLRSKRDEDS
jgi:hypothetical protein